MFSESAAALYYAKYIWQQHHHQHMKETLANTERGGEKRKPQKLHFKINGVLVKL